MPMTKKEHEKELRCYPAALTAAEVAEILRVSTKTVYKLIKDKSLPAVKVGRENRIAKSPLDGDHLGVGILRRAVDAADKHFAVGFIIVLCVAQGSV